jgi:hypothetical protein
MNLELLRLKQKKRYERCAYLSCGSSLWTGVYDGPDWLRLCLGYQLSGEGISSAVGNMNIETAAASVANHSGNYMYRFQFFPHQRTCVFRMDLTKK